MALTLVLKRKYTSYVNFVYEDISDWAGSGVDIATVTAASLVITGDGYSKTTDVLADYPTGLVFTVPYDSDGTIIPDGRYRAVLTVTADGDDYTVTLDTGSYFEVQASVFQRISRIPEYFKCNNCCTTFIKETMCMFLLLQSVIYAAQYDDIAEFEDILATLTQMLSYDTTWELT
jgi:hypothetical protein